MMTPEMEKRRETKRVVKRLTRSCVVPEAMAPGGQQDMLQLLGIGGGEHGGVSAERLEQLYQEVAPQVRGASATKCVTFLN